jgi:hypothetical protein
MTIKNYAFIKNGIVVNTVVFDNPNEETLAEFKNFHNVDLIIEAEEKTQVGGTYENSVFWPVQPYPSWVKNEELIEWWPPVAYPDDGKTYKWNEDILNWEEIQVLE